MTIHFNFSCDHQDYSVDLKPADEAQGSVTIAGKTYTISGNPPGLVLLQQHMASLGTTNFTNMRQLQVMLRYTGIDCKEAEVFGKVMNKDTTEVSKVVSQKVTDTEELAKIREQTIEDLKDNKPASEIADNISKGISNFIKRMYEETEQKLGPPPCKYCVLGLGSLGRREAGPFPDYDNFVVMEDNTDETKRYFTKLNQHISDRVVRLGETHGFHLCDSNLNPPYQKYEYRYASPHIEGESSPRVEDLPYLLGRLDLLTAKDAIAGSLVLGDVVDSAPIMGDPELHREFMTNIINRDPLEDSAISNIKRNVDGIIHEGSPITAEELPVLIHVKNQIFRFPQATVTSLAIIHGIKEVNTIERIEKLRQLKVFSDAFAAKLTTAVEFAIKLRVQAQAAYGEEFELVSTADYNTFMKNNNALKAQLQQTEKQILAEQKILADRFPEVKDAIDNYNQTILRLDEEIAKARSPGKIKQCEEEKIEAKHKLSKTNLEILHTATALAERNGPADEHAKIKGMFASIANKYGNRDFYMDALDTKIIDNQYYKETNKPAPPLVAFTPADKKMLENEVLPTLRNLFEMAQASLQEEGKFDSTQFAK